jgi:hypothetical protein
MGGDSHPPSDGTTQKRERRRQVMRKIDVQETLIRVTQIEVSDRDYKALKGNSRITRERAKDRCIAKLDRKRSNSHNPEDESLDWVSIDFLGEDGEELFDVGQQPH